MGSRLPLRGLCGWTVPGLVTQTLAGYLGLSCLLLLPSINFARSKREAHARFPLLFLAKPSILTRFVWL
jgi:hypothetical protein